MKEIKEEIVDFEIVKDSETGKKGDTNLKDNVVQMHEKLERPGMLHGATYKITTPFSEHALYVTINDIVLNGGTEHELRRPFEIFINSKNLDHFQWIVALTRIVSAIFRKGGDINFLVEELHSVFAPRGGYFKKGGKFKPSLVAEIGDVLEKHLKMIGMLKEDKLNKCDSFPNHATLCAKCHTKAVVNMDNCDTCLNCGEGKCS